MLLNPSTSRTVLNTASDGAKYFPLKCWAKHLLIIETTIIFKHTMMKINIEYQIFQAASYEQRQKLAIMWDVAEMKREGAEFGLLYHSITFTIMTEVDAERIVEIPWKYILKKKFNNSISRASNYRGWFQSRHSISPPILFLALLLRKAMSQGRNKACFRTNKKNIVTEYILHKTWSLMLGNHDGFTGCTAEHKGSMKSFISRHY